MDNAEQQVLDAIEQVSPDALVIFAATANAAPIVQQAPRFAQWLWAALEAAHKRRRGFDCPHPSLSLSTWSNAELAHGLCVASGLPAADVLPTMQQFGQAVAKAFVAHSAYRLLVPSLN